MIARALLALLLATAPALAAAPRRAAVKPVDWTTTIAATPEGGYRIGNPAAKLKLVEYGSLTCPHCRAFHVAGFAALKANYVAGGKLSYEYRSLVLNGVDFAAVLLARCNGPASFFTRTDMFYQTQPQWIQGAAAMSPADRAAIQSAPPEQVFALFARASKLDSFVAARGIAPARQQQCLTDKAAIDKVTAMRAASGALGVTGTPEFYLNGVLQQTGEGLLARHILTWEDLEPRLSAALR